MDILIRGPALLVAQALNILASCLVVIYSFVDCEVVYFRREDVGWAKSQAHINGLYSLVECAI